MTARRPADVNSDPTAELPLLVIGAVDQYGLAPGSRQPSAELRDVVVCVEDRDGAELLNLTAPVPARPRTWSQTVSGPTRFTQTDYGAVVRSELNRRRVEALGSKRRLGQQRGSRMRRPVAAATPVGC